MKKYNSVKLFLLDKVCMIILGILLYLGVFIWNRDKYILIVVFVTVSSIYYFNGIVNLFNIIIDVKKNRIITEKLYIRYLCERRFDCDFFKKYYDIKCHKVKGKKYTHEEVYLKASKMFDIQVKTFVEISYYEKSKIVKNISSLEVERE